MINRILNKADLKFLDLDEKTISQEISEILSRQSENISDEIYYNLLKIIDLTSLNENDTENKIKMLCSQAKEMRETIDKKAIASVCVFPKFVKQVSSELKNTAIRVASVAGNFPSGRGILDEKLNEVKFALEQGADEIDYVISREYIFSERYDKLFDEIKSVKSLCGNSLLKTILETGELQNNEIYIASSIALQAGADFIKTSTGKTPIGATLTSAYIMLKAIKEYHQETGKFVGFKASGGISNPEQAIQYYLLTKNVLSLESIDKSKMRIGASRLAKELVDMLSNVKK